MRLTLPTTHRTGTGSSRELQHGRPIVASGFESVPRQLFLALLVAAGYYLGSRVGSSSHPWDADFDPLAAERCLLAALLLAPYRKWWLLLLAVFPAHLLIQLPTGVPLTTASGWFISNSAEALLGASIVRYFKKPKERFESVSGVLAFIAFGVILATLPHAFMVPTEQFWWS